MNNGTEPLAGVTGITPYQKYITPFQQNVEKAASAKAEVAGLEKGMEAGRTAQKIKDVGAAEETFAQRSEAAPQRAELQRVGEEIEKPFVPTQQSAKDMAALFSLINVVGFAIGAGGKRNSQAAMSAMSGMLEGSRKGRDDLYKQEKNIFDTNIKQLKTRYDILDRQLKEALETYKTDKELGMRKAEMAYAEAGASFYKQYADKFGLAATYEAHKQFYDAANRTYAEIKREEQRAKEINLREENLKIQRDRLAVAQDKAARGPAAKAGATSTSPGGAIQFRYNAAMTNAGNQLAMEIGNAASLPIKATPPAAAEVLTNPSKGLTDASVAFFAQKITDEEARAMQQVLAGMQRAITTIEASGRPSGSTEGAIKEFGKTMPRGGDSKINTYLFLAQARQVMEILVKDLKAAGGSPEQIAQAEEAKKNVDNKISWTVQDVNRILSAGGRTLVDTGVQQALAKSENLRQLNKELSAKAPSVDVDKERSNAQAAIASGKDETAVKARFKERTGQEL